MAGKAVGKRAVGRPKELGLAERRREQILDVAAALFAKRGFADTDIDSVADDLQVGKGTVYRYFPSKRELFLAAVDRGLQRLNAAVLQRTAEVADPLERIAAAIRAFLEFFEKAPELVELFVQERATFKDGRKPAYFVHHEANVGPWRKMYQQMVADGRVRDLPTKEQDIVNDLLYGTILANHFTGRKVSHKVQAAGIVDIVFHGILSDAERKRREKANRV